MPYHYSIFEATLRKRGRMWWWRVCTVQGEIVMKGSENSRPAARYKSDRALFLLLLSASYLYDSQSQNLVARPRPGLGAGSDC
jgi:hypothetical protein